MQNPTLPVAVLSLSLITLAAGCGTKTYSVSPPVLDGADVTVYAKLKKNKLETDTSAGKYSVRGVRLVLADGSTLKPTISTSTMPKTGGGLRLGTGVGIGVGSSSAVGVGTSVGGRRIVPGPREARWDNPPIDRQPFTLHVGLDTDPRIDVYVPLGEVTGTEPAPAGSDADRIETWELVDGTTARYLVTETEGEGPPTYERIP